MTCKDGRFNTGNKLCSNDLRDLNDNSIIVDGYVNSDELYIEDRLGVERLTLTGIEKKVDDSFVGIQDRADAQYSEIQDRADTQNTAINDRADSTIGRFEGEIDAIIKDAGGVEVVSEFGNSVEDAISQKKISEHLGQDSEGNTVIKSGDDVFTLPAEEGELALNKVTEYGFNSNTSVEGVIITDIRLNQDAIGSSKGAFIQSIVWDYQTNSFYASADLGDSKGNVIHKIPDTQLRWTLPEHGLKTSKPSTEIGHQGLGIFYPDNTPTFILPKGGTQDQMHFIKLIKVDDMFKDEVVFERSVRVFSEGESRGSQSNTVGSSGCHNFFVVHGVDELEKMALVKVFRSASLTSGLDDISNDYLAKFHIDAFKVGTGKIGIQSITTDGNFVYCNIYDTGLKEERLLIYNIGGLLVSNDVIRTGLAWRASESSAYYEPEGLFWYRYEGSLRLCLSITGVLASGLRKNALFVLGDGSSREGVYTEYSKLYFKSGKRKVGVAYRASGASSNSMHIEGIEGNVKQSPSLIFRDFDDSHPNKGALMIAHGCDGVSNAWTVFKDEAIWTEGKSLDLGRSQNTYKDIYLTNQPTVTSDTNAKFDIKDIDEKYMRVMSRLKFKQFKLKAGTSGRTHFGIIAQEWIAACNAEGVDPKESGVLVGDEKTGYAIRYNELQILFNAYVMHKISMLQ